MTKEEYNEVPVEYCTTCRSLAIVAMDDGTAFCEKCGSTEIAITHIEDWKEKNVKHIKTE